MWLNLSSLFLGFTFDWKNQFPGNSTHSKRSVKVSGIMLVEADFRIIHRKSNIIFIQLLTVKYINKGHKQNPLKMAVGPLGIEPSTYWLWVSCSNRMSYRPVLRKDKNLGGNIEAPCLFQNSLLQTFCQTRAYFFLMFCNTSRPDSYRESHRPVLDKDKNLGGNIEAPCLFQNSFLQTFRQTRAYLFLLFCETNRPDSYRESYRPFFKRFAKIANFRVLFPDGIG